MSGTLKIAGTTLATNPSNSKVEIDDAVSGKGICKVWVNFNGVTADSSTNLIGVRDQHNVSSLQDHAAGDYTVTFATALDDNNYCISISGSSNTSISPPSYFGSNPSQSSGYSYGTWASHTSLAIENTHIRFQIAYPINPTLYDTTVVCVAIFGS